MDNFDSTNSNSGILKNWYEQKSVSDALKKRREKLSETKGIYDASENLEERGGAKI